MTVQQAKAIEIQELVKSFGHQRALRGVSLSVAEGEFLTLFGPNGAGKTTLIRVLASLTRPTAGVVRVRGEDLSKTTLALRRQIGLISHSPLLYGDLTPDENLRFFARMYDLHAPAARIDAVLEQVGLTARRRDPVRTFSRGMVQRLTIARAILHDPTIMLLDEPYTGLDLQAADMLRAVLQEFAASNTTSPQRTRYSAEAVTFDDGIAAKPPLGLRRTVILTTHNLEQGLEMCDRAVILNRGMVAWEGLRAGLDLADMKEIYRSVTGRAGGAQSESCNTGRGRR